MSADETKDCRLVLGGHSFIAQFGSDPPTSFDEQCRIVETCLDRGLRRFDCTYQPERIALGNVLHALGRRNEAIIFAWNFFTDFDPHDPDAVVGGSRAYEPRDINVILEQLRTNFVDCLVVHPEGDGARDTRQVELAKQWQKSGYARSLGVWIPDALLLARYRGNKAFKLAISPFNVTTENAPTIFFRLKDAGWETLATSPFVRGWELDRMVAAAAARGDGPPEALRHVLADALLRYSLFKRDVDRVIVAMRKPEWVERNLASAARGPLSAEERTWLESLRAPAERKPRWWRRFRR